MIAATGPPADAETPFRPVAAAADALWVAELLGRSSHETIHYLRPDGSLLPAAECPMLSPRRTGETIQVEQDAFVRKDGTQVAVSYSSADPPISGYEAVGR